VAVRGTRGVLNAGHWAGRSDAKAVERKIKPAALTSVLILYTLFTDELGTARSA
jgi:hypothetical protein